MRKQWKLRLIIFVLVIFAIGSTTIDAQAGIIEDIEEEIANLQQALMDLTEDIDDLEEEESDLLDTLSSLSDSIANVDVYISSAEAHLVMAVNDAERQDWQDVIDDLNAYRDELADDYTYATSQLTSVQNSLQLANTEYDELYSDLIDAFRRLFLFGN